MMRQPVSMKVVKSKLLTLITSPEMTTQQMSWIHVTSHIQGAPIKTGEVKTFATCT